MKKNFKKLFILLVFVIASVISTAFVSAEAVLDSFKANSKTIETPISFTTEFHVIKTTDGKHIYCLEYRKKSPDESIIYTKDSIITDNGMNYLLKEGKNAKSDTEHFIYKSALWIYMVENGLMEGTNRNIKEYYEEVKQSKTAEAKKILELVENAKKTGANDTSAPTIKLDTGTKTFKLDNGYYVSNAITVTSSTGAYEVKLTNAPENSKVEKNGNTFVIKVPANSFSTLNTEINFEVSNAKDVYVSYRYKPSDSNYQPVAATYKETKTANVEETLLIEKQTGGVEISKQDITNNKELPGATLQIKDANGNTKDEWTWVSTDKPHYIDKLLPGTYTLTEIIAPEGYILSEETITFTVDADGKTEPVVMYNTPKTGGVQISKQDITNKKELPGATLVIKDTNGNIIDEWVSTDKPHYIEKLAPGMYTLTETIAPDGYVLSDETKTFTVKDDGTITKVVMYNAPSSKDVPMEPTSSFKSMTSTLLGTLVIALGSFVIFKNYKKKENA